jgi:hypothetical protein
VTDVAPALQHRTSGEREVLAAFVEDQRLELLYLLDDITEQQARRRLVASDTTVLGLVKHAAWCERSWFTVYLGRRGTRAELGMAPGPTESFLLAPEDTIASVRADFEAACATSREILAGLDLDDTLDHPRMGVVSVRWILLHLVREHARHAGHGDILREQLTAR